MFKRINQMPLASWYSCVGHSLIVIRLKQWMSLLIANCHVSHMVLTVAEKS